VRWDRETETLPSGRQRRAQMDAIILVAVVFFALAIAYANGLDKL
jgi:hypothetical protein